MAKPDLDDGYLRLAYELLCAILVTRLGVEGVVIWEILAQIYGWGKLSEARLSPTEIAQRARLDKSNVHRAITKLAKAGIIIRISETEPIYRFVKDYEKWDLGMSPEQRGSCLSYICHAPLLAKSYRHELAKDESPEPLSEVTTDQPKPVVTSDNGTEESYGRDRRSVVRTDNDPLSVLTTQPCPPLCTPPGNMKEKEEEECVLVPRTHTEGASSVPTLGPDLTTEPESSPPNGSPLRSPEDAALVRQAASMLRSNIQTEHLGIALLRNDSLPECMSIAGWKWVRAAEKILSPTIDDDKRRWPYFLAVAANLTEASRNSPSVNGSFPRKPTPQERSRQFSEGIKRSDAIIKALEEEL